MELPVCRAILVGLNVERPRRAVNARGLVPIGTNDRNNCHGRGFSARPDTDPRNLPHLWAPARSRCHLSRRGSGHRDLLVPARPPVDHQVDGPHLMPREHAQVNIGIWEDPDFRALPPQAQHLYFVLWMDPGLSYCGVVDWRPGRIAPRSAGWRVDDLKDAADCLRARHFIVTDDESEECLIRSWVRWDGLMKQPRLAVSYANAYGSVGSNLIRGVIIDELHKLRERQPGLPGLSSPRVVQMFELPRVRAKASVSVRDPFGDGFGHRFGPGLGETLPNVSGSVSVPPTPSPTPSPNSNSEESGSRKRGTRITAEWLPDPLVRSQMQQERPDVDLKAEHAKFIDHWMSQPGQKGVKLDWDRTWRNWIRNARGSGLRVVNGGRKTDALGFVIE